MKEHIFKDFADKDSTLEERMARIPEKLSSRRSAGMTAEEAMAYMPERMESSASAICEKAVRSDMTENAVGCNGSIYGDALREKFGDNDTVAEDAVKQEM